MKSPTDQRQWYRIVNKKDAAVSTADVYIYDEIGYWGTTAADFTRELATLDVEQINLHINSPGGEIFDGVAIYNAVKSHKANVTVYVDALAASAASFIAQAGDEIIMTRNATMMIHDGMAICIGNEKDMLDTADLLNKLSNNIADIYAQNAGGTIESWRALMREEVWYTAQEAVDAGLATSVLDTADAEAENAKNKWDLSVFNHAGRENAPSPTKVYSQVMNRVKEAPVQPKNTDQPPAEPEETPPTAAPTGDTGEGEAQLEEDQSQGRQPEVPVTQPEGEPSNKAAGVSFMVNGAACTDVAAVQRHINSLEGFRKETIENGRKEFVKNLVSGNKVAATQTDTLEKFALGLSDEQYEMWRASWDAAPSLALLGSHAAGTSNHTGTPDPAAEKAASDLETAREIVMQHKRAGMPTEQIEKTPSYMKLKQNDPNFTLN